MTQQPSKLSDPVHFTRLRQLGARSPAHYRAAVLEANDPTTYMELGQAIHAVVLHQPYVVWHGKVRNGKVWDVFKEEHEGHALIITEGQYETAMRCADAVAAKPDATRLLSGEYEIYREWSVLRRACAGTIDVIGRDFITELKTTTNAHPETFHRAGLKIAYHAQLGWYLDGIGHPEHEAYCVAIEVKPPFAVSIFQMTRRALEEGRKLSRLWMEQLLACEASNEWPDYCQSIIPFDVLDDESTTLIIDGEEVAA